MAYRAAVVGGSGYTGAELLRLLAGHPEIEVVHVTADCNAGAARRGRCIPSLAPAYADLALRAARRRRPARASISCSARCRTARARRCCPSSSTTSAHVVDLGADFRLPPDVYARWYGEPHRAPELVDRFAYGLVELYRDDLAHARARRVARLLSDRGEPRAARRCSRSISSSRA